MVSTYYLGQPVTDEVQLADVDAVNTTSGSIELTEADGLLISQVTYDEYIRSMPNPARPMRSNTAPGSLWTASSCES